jgi:hypothetical protein
MSSRLFATGAAVAASIMIAACADAPQPTGPEDPPEAAVGRGQDPLPGWFARASVGVMALPGTVFADHDEAGGRLVFGVENAAAIRGVQTALTRLGIPASVTTVKVVPPIYQVATLRDRFRPTQGGIQIHFGNYLCTMGFNADDGTQRSFITNSHCTGKQGGVQGTQYYQPLSSVDATVIAAEVEDPQYLRGIAGCPNGKKCRRSDASRALYSAGVASTRGAIAKTSAPNNGSLNVTGTFTVTAQDNTTTNFAGGTTVNKVGRTTGWTQGEVSGSCATVNVSGTNITQICQTLVSRAGAVLVGGGDSGSGVFRITSGDNVQLVGILWGGNGDGSLFVFSPLSNIRQELGAIVATN